MLKRMLMLLLSLVAVAQAQLFDSINPEGVLKDIDVKGTIGNLAPADPAAQPLADTSYQYSGQRLLGKKFVEMIQADPNLSAQVPSDQLPQVEQAMNQVLDQFDALVAGIGENPHDLGTAMAAFFEFSYDLFHGLDKAPTDAQTLATIKQWRVAISQTPDLLQKSNEERQFIAEALAGVPFFYIALQQAYMQAGQTQEAEQMRQAGIDLFQQMTGFSIEEVQYTDGGIYIPSLMAQTAPPLPMAEAQANPTQENLPQPTNPLAPLAQPQMTNPLAAAPADPFVGDFKGESISVHLEGSSAAYTGELVFNGQAFPVQAVAEVNVLKGTFSSSGTPFEFSARLDGAVLTLESGGNTFMLEKVAKNPLGN